MFLYKSVSIKTRKRPHLVSSYVDTRGFEFSFPKPMLVVEDPVFLQLIDPDWASCQLIAHLPKKSLVRLVKSAIEENNSLGVFFKSQLLGVSEHSKYKKINNQEAIECYGQLISKFPMLELLFEEYTKNSACFQFKLNLRDYQFQHLLKMSGVDLAIQENLTRFWQSKLDKDTYIYTNIGIDSYGRIKDPFSANKKIYITKKLPKGTKIIMMYSFRNQTLSFFQNQNSKPLKVVNLRSAKGTISIETLENSEKMSYRKMYEDYRINSSFERFLLDDLKTGLNILPNVSVTCFTKYFISAGREKTISLPLRLREVLEGVEARCRQALIKIPSQHTFKVYKSLIFDFVHNNKKQRLIFMNNKGENNTVSEDTMLQFSVPLTDIIDNNLYLPHLNSNMLIDYKNYWDKIKIQVDTNNNIVGINKVYTSGESIPLKLKIIIPLAISKTKTILVSENHALSQQARAMINGVLKIEPYFTNTALYFEIGKTIKEEQLYGYTVNAYTSLGSKLYSLIKSGLIINPETIAKNIPKAELTAENLNFSSEYIEKLQLAEVDIGKLLDWLKSRKFAAKKVEIDFDTITKQTIEEIKQEIIEYFRNNSKDSVNAPDLASGLLQNLLRLYLNFNYKKLSCHAVMEKGFPLAYIFQYQDQFFRPYEFKTIRASNNDIVRTCVKIHNKQILENSKAYRQELNKIIILDKLENIQEKGWEEKHRFSIEDTTFVHLIKAE